MSLNVYFNNPFTTATKVGLVDTYTGDGVTQTFTLVNKTNILMGGTVQFDALQYYLYNGGFTKVGTTQFTTQTAPPAGSQGVAPAAQTLTFAMFDQAVVPGTVNPNISQIPIYLAADDIQTYLYQNFPTLTGIEVAFVALITSNSVAANVAWIQLACSGNFGAVGTYQAANTPLVTAGLLAFTQMACASSSGSNTTLQVNSAAGFITNDWIRINPGVANSSEDCRINSVSIGLNTITVDGTNFGHNPGEPIYTCGRLIYALCTVPNNATGGQAGSFFNIACRVRSAQYVRS